MFIRLINLVVLTKLLDGYSLDIEDFEHESVSGVHLHFYNSIVCRELPFKVLKNFKICFFTKTEIAWNPALYNIHIVYLFDSEKFIGLDQDSNSLILKDNGNITKYLKESMFVLWKKICLLNNKNTSDTEISVNYRQPKRYTADDEELFKNYKTKTSESKAENYNPEMPSDIPFGWNSSFSSFIPKSGNASICFGNPYHSYSSYNISIAGLHIMHNQSTRIPENDNCIEYLKNDELQDFADHIWNSNNDTQLHLTITEICLDTFAIPFIVKSLNYAEHTQICNRLDGRLLHLEEVWYFRHYLQKSTSFYFMDEYNPTPEFWLFGGTTQFTFKDFCPLLSFPSNISVNSTFRMQKEPCFFNLKLCFCIVPHITDFNYYGQLVKFEKNLYISRRTISSVKMDFSFSIEGILGTLIRLGNGKWVLYNSLYDDSEAYEIISTLPVGRQNWTSRKDGKEHLLTFTHCKSNEEFECSNGTCLPWNVRCNGVVDCLDKSDEEKCSKLVKDEGYSVHVPPLPRTNEKSLYIYYNVTLFNIYDITSIGTSIKIQAEINLSWHDKRIQFWNIAKSENINMKDIWKPELTLVGDAYPGYKITMDEDEFDESCKSDPESFEGKDSRIFSYTDPYMGTFIKGEDMKILYTFKATIDVPCRFDLRRYPFGKQSCNIAIWIENVEENSNYEFVYKGRGSKIVELTYNGRKDLGEYNFVSASHTVDELRAILITINLKNLYGFHMLNSFVPSVLICIISYCTLVFPITHFSDRVMVSLTALLVLTALFSQSSNTSVKTSYYKLLDIWYVVIIFYSFMIVIFNTWLHKFISIEKRKEKKNMSNFKDDKYEEVNAIKFESESQWKKKLVYYNSIAIVFFSLFYVLFISFFSYAAAEII